MRRLSSLEHVFVYSHDLMAKNMAISISSAIAVDLGSLECWAKRIANLMTDIGTAFWCCFLGSWNSYPRKSCFRRKQTSPSTSYLGSGSPADLNPCDTFARVSRTDLQANLLVWLVAKWQSQRKVQKARRISCFCGRENISRRSWPRKPTKVMKSSQRFQALSLFCFVLEPFRLLWQ